MSLGRSKWTASVPFVSTDSTNTTLPPVLQTVDIDPHSHAKRLGLLRKRFAMLTAEEKALAFYHRTFHYFRDLGRAKNAYRPEKDYYERDTHRANLISSMMSGEERKPPMQRLHLPVIDIDHHVFVVESSTDGHSHLYINTLMKWSDYLRLLKVMVDVGLVEQGYYDAAVKNEQTHVRVPGLEKPILKKELPF